MRAHTYKHKLDETSDNNSGYVFSSPRWIQYEYIQYMEDYRLLHGLATLSCQKYIKFNKAKGCGIHVSIKVTKASIEK